MCIYKVAEKFVSINGEGPLAGQPAVFIRLAGCSLRCSYCDTAWAQECGGEECSLEKLVWFAAGSGVRNVTLTGGEPLEAEGVTELVMSLMSAGCHVEIETNGSRDISELAGLCPRPAFTLDYKLPGSGMEAHMLMSNYDLLLPCDAVKFVAGGRADLERAAEIIREYSLTEKCRVYISTVFGKLSAKEAAEFIISEKLNGAALQLQLHKYIWDPDKRGV